MKKIHILGAGLVAKPKVDYFLAYNYFITLVDLEIEKAQKLVNNHPNGVVIGLDVSRNADSLDELISNHDITINILLPQFMPSVAKLCIKNKKNLIGTNYVSPETKKLDSQAKEVEITIVDEVGLDPGIDHMIAKKIIDEAHAKGSKVVSFKSYCGGLPASDSNDNPFGYKFSWSPRGVLAASQRNALFKENNKYQSISAEKIFNKENIRQLFIKKDIGTLEVYANHDSIKYIGLYAIPEVETIYRSTLRYSGWAESIKALIDLNYLSLDELNAQKTYSQFLADLIKSPNKNIKSEVAQFLQLNIDSEIIAKLEWLGLFLDELIQTEHDKISPLDLLTAIMVTKMSYQKGERDLIILINEFIIENKDNSKEIVTSSLIEYGEKDGSSAMSKTVAYPVIICSELLLEGKIEEKGVIIPISRDIYNPVLEKLQDFGIKIHITKKSLS